MPKNYLYIKVDKNNMVQKKDVHLQDIAKIFSTDKKMVDHLNGQIILKINQNKQSNYVISILKIIEIISELYPDVKIENLGEKDFIIHYDPPKKTIKLLDYLKVLGVSLMVFFGAAFTIMSFNTDAGVDEVFKNVYEFIMDKKKDGATILEISYAIGLPTGIIIFFNHFSKAQLNKDPTPMQVQMRMYEENLDMTIIENANREDRNIDAN